MSLDLAHTTISPGEVVTIIKVALHAVMTARVPS